ncbi:MAG: hypothetical protein ACOX0Z_03510 [Candidatus Nanosyncoccaceae bacterium]
MKGFRTLEVSLSNSCGFYMSVPITKNDCAGGSAYWYLIRDRQKIGTFSTDGTIAYLPEDVVESVVEEAKKLTHRYRRIIEDVYSHNRKHGS